MPNEVGSQLAPPSIRRGEEGPQGVNWREMFSDPWVKRFTKFFLVLLLLTATWIFFTKAGKTLMIAGGAVLLVGTAVWWYRRKPSYIRHGGKTLGSILTGQSKIIMWLVFHVAFWSFVARFSGWEYVGEWWWGKYRLIFLPMHLIYVCRGVLPNNITGQLRFGNLITMGALALLFTFMLVEATVHCKTGGSIVPNHMLAGSAGYNIPGLHSAKSEKLMPGQFSVWAVPEGRDASGVLKRMEVGVLPAGTKWIQIFKVGGRVYTDKLIYTFTEGKLEVEDKIRVVDYRLPTPDTDGDGYLTVSQSPLWLVLADGLGGWRLVHPDKLELATPLASDTVLYVLFNSDQMESGNGVVNLEIRSGV